MKTMERLQPNCIVLFNGDTCGLDAALRYCAALGALDFYYVVRDEDNVKFMQYALARGGFEMA